jgi:hypothetical protein
MLISMKMKRSIRYIVIDTSGYLCIEIDIKTILQGKDATVYERCSQANPIQWCSIA